MDEVDPMQELIDELEARTEYVVSFHRIAEADMDRDPSPNAFAFLIGADSDNALIVEGGISGDGATATTTVWAISGGKRGNMQTIDLDGQMMHSISLA
jgi:hypothetical protein